MDGKWLSIEDETGNSGEIPHALRGLIPLRSTLNGENPLHVQITGMPWGGNNALFDSVPTR